MCGPTPNLSYYRVHDRISRDGEKHTKTRLKLTSFHKIKSCEVKKGVSGLVCGKTELNETRECVDQTKFCKSSSHEICHHEGIQVASNDADLCRSTQFWGDRSCNSTRNGYEYNGVRCTGDRQQCVYPWYLSETPAYEAGYHHSQCKT